MAEFFFKLVVKVLAYGVPGLLWSAFFWHVGDLLWHYRDPAEIVWMAVTTHFIIGVVACLLYLHQEHQKLRLYARRIIDEAGVRPEHISEKTRRDLAYEGQQSFWRGFSWWLLMSVLPMAFWMVLLEGLFHSGN